MYVYNNLNNFHYYWIAIELLRPIINDLQECLYAGQWNHYNSEGTDTHTHTHIPLCLSVGNGSEQSHIKQDWVLGCLLGWMVKWPEIDDNSLLLVVY